MNVRLIMSFEKLAAWAGLVLFAAGAGWGWTGREQLAQLRAISETVALSGESFRPAPHVASEASVAAWRKPGAQRGGPGWVYELFTPPDIYYDTVARAFDVVPPAVEAEGALPFGLELLEVKRAPYRLQLVGYFGSADDYTGTFSSPQLPGALLARAGSRFTELGLVLKSFSVGLVPVGPGEDGALFERTASAVLEDLTTGELVTLDSRGRKLTDMPLAVLRLKGGATKPRELREGDSVQDGQASYRVERIQFDPPEVVVLRTLPDRPRTEARVLRLASSEAGAKEERSKNPSDAPAQRRSETNLVSADKEH
ncbi:MAG: hypothetical protein HYV95_13365 [Opitutae bacterium]|nr:hypothetical protein [Opitutae bacterium]